MKRTTNICPLAALSPSDEAVARAADIIRQGGVVIFPTRGLYGLGADAFNPKAIERIFALKGRDPQKPLLVLIDDPGRLLQVALPPNAMARHLMQHFWPGRVTFVLPARSDTPPVLTGGSGKIGVRLAAHPVAVALLKAVGGPLTGTSANLSGAGGCASVEAIDDAVKQAVDLILDVGPLMGGLGSTVVDVSGDRPVILRAGTVAAAEISRVLALIRVDNNA